MVKVIYRKSEWEVEAGITVRQAMERVGLDPRQVLAVRHGKLIADEALLEEGDEITLVSIISGG